MESYDQAIQPRQRGDRTASDVQIAEIASRLDPERLGDSAEADRGAPIVGPDGMVESGNGRVMAIRRAYQSVPESAQRYRQWLADQGYNVEGIANPVLVRRRLTEMTPEQRRLILAHCKPDLTDFLTAILYTAARPGDLAKATVGDFNAKEKTLRLVTNQGRHGTPRPYHADLTDDAAALIQRHARLRLKTLPLLVNEFDRPWQKKHWSAKLRAAVAAANAEGAKLPEGVGAYFLLAFSLAARVDEKNIDAIMTYVDRFTQFEASTLFVSTLASNKHKVGMACRSRQFTSACAKLGRYF
jgi:hypothetical protein